jgi:hypothetical protein
MSKTLAGAFGAVLLFVTPAAAMDCGAMLNSHTAEINKMTKATPEKRAALTRMALAGYDNCLAGDKSSAEKLFKMIMDAGN